MTNDGERQRKAVEKMKARVTDLEVSEVRGVIAFEDNKIACQILGESFVDYLCIPFLPIACTQTHGEVVGQSIGMSCWTCCSSHCHPLFCAKQSKYNVGVVV